jgi:hypothetical protein
VRTQRRRALRGGLAAEALWSPCGHYRYALTLTWDAGGTRLLAVLLNPSTASERQDDPTLARLRARARSLGFGALRVVNLFALCATDPRALARAEDPVGPQTDRVLATSLARWRPAAVLAGWGAHGPASRAAEVEARLRASGLPLWHLGLTAGGAPRHPLYLSAALAPEVWAPPPQGT